MVKIAVYTIALNEEKHVAQWAEATKGADYRLVCDTGSTDKTVELLKKHKIDTYKISVKPWRFDSARNTALNLVPDDVDVCLILDMDEVPEPGFFDKVREQWTLTANRGWVGLNTGNTWAYSTGYIRARDSFGNTLAMKLQYLAWVLKWSIVL